ncbi:MAG: LamG domain-containing protein, partial [Promethearchaeota archaeon]
MSERKTPKKLLEIQTYFTNMLSSRKSKRIPLPYHDMESKIAYNTFVTAEYRAKRNTTNSPDTMIQTKILSIGPSKNKSHNDVIKFKQGKREKREDFDFISILQKLGTYFSNIKIIAWLIAFSGISFISFFLYSTMGTPILPYELICGFVYFMYIAYLLLQHITLKGYIFPVKRAFYFLVNPILVFVLISYFLAYHLPHIAAAIIPLMLITSAIILYKQSYRSEAKYIRRTHATADYSSISMAYHRFKMPIITFFLIIFGGVFLWMYFFAPFLNYIPPILIIISVFLFTFKSKKAIRRLYKEFKRKKEKRKGLKCSFRTLKEYLVIFNDSHRRAALLMLIFLILFPISFIVNSMKSIECSPIWFGYISPEEQIDPSSILVEEIEYYSSPDEMDELSINGKFVVKSKISPKFGQSAMMRIRLIPKDVHLEEGQHIQPFYDFRSNYVTGPLENFNLFTEIDLSQANLLPGTYEIECYYTELTGFSFTTSLPREYEITIEKDSMQILSSGRYKDLPEEYYGAVWTVENEIENAWKVHYDGKLVNSINEPLSNYDLDLFIEDQDSWKYLDTITTDKSAHFYYEYIIYGAIEMNLMVKIAHQGSQLYKPLNYEEFAGLEYSYEFGRYFVDENNDWIPDWGFTLADLMKALLGRSYTPPDSLDFIASFSENLGSSTFDAIHNYEGTIQGNTTWIIGRSGYGLYFDGDNDYVDFGDVLDIPFGTANNEFVASLWILPTLYSSTQSSNGVKNCFLSKTGNFELGINESGYLQVYIKTYTKEAIAYYGFEGAIPINNWRYIAVRYNNSDCDVLIGDTWFTSALGTTAEPWSGGGNLVSGSNFIIGAETTSNSCFTGKIDEVSVFNTSLSNSQIEKHSFQVTPHVSKEDGLGGWTPITSAGEILDGYINFQCSISGRNAKEVQYYLSNIEPNIEVPNIEDWYLLTSYSYYSTQYNYVYDSRDLPDNSTWYFIVKATDIYNDVVYTYYETYFGIDHFDELINFTYIAKGGRINHNSQIGVVSYEGCEGYISQLHLYVNYSNNIEYLTTINNTDLYQNYWLLDLQSLSSWVTQKSLSPGNYELNFIVEANLSYSIGKNFYLYNYSLPSVTLDILASDMELITTLPYNLKLASTYNIVEQNVISMAINSSDPYFDYVVMEYKYTTPSTATWQIYNTFHVDNNSLVEISCDILNFKDDNITLRFVGFDDLGNSKTLYQGNFWFIKDFNNHQEFAVDGLSNSILYPLDQDKMIDLELKVLPFDNDITKITISTSFESFILDTIYSESNYIYFSDSGTEEIRLNSTFYNIFGTDICFIPVTVKQYQGTTFITSKEEIIAVLTRVFNDSVAIDDLEINIWSDAIWMSFQTGLNAYNNTHSIPFIYNNQLPLVNIYNSYNECVETIKLLPNLDTNATEVYDTGQIEISENRFIVPLPTPQTGEVCSIEEVNVNGTSYQFSYFINDATNELLITLLTLLDLDGIYGATGPITIKHGISTSIKNQDQFVGIFDFDDLSQDNYTFKAEFYDISGAISTYAITIPITIDLHGPDIYKQFSNSIAVNPESGIISFLITDFSGVTSYKFNTTINGYWSIQ